VTRPMPIIFVVLVGLGLASVVGAGPVARAMPDSATLSKECYATVGPVLQNSEGKLTPEVRNAYLAWAEKTVLRELHEGGQTVPEACLAEVKREGTLRDAVFGSVYPPDPSILQNYAELRAELGPQYIAKYRSLVIAISISRRTKGVENADAVKNIGRDYQIGFWTDESLQNPGSEPEKDFIRRIASFMKEAQVTAANLYVNVSLQDHLKTVLAEQHVPANFIGEVRKSVQFGERLKDAMVILKQRPGAREPKPATVAWMRHLAALNEAKPSSTPNQWAWPLFPIDTAPWPLLMPLAHAVPLSEADYIWEAFQGEHGDDRYHTYGPYRGDDDVMPDSLRPSRWFWDAWPDRVVHGGMCVPISKGTVDLYTCLNKPAMWAGQPGHANLISFQVVNKAYTAEIEQDFAGGPTVTNAQWYFDEDPGTQIRYRDLYYWAGAEYHLGLALGMNLGVKSYMDTRLAANIFKTIPAEDRPTMGVKLLRYALLVNPFNPEIWYRLAESNPDPMLGMTLVQAVQQRKPGLLGSGSTSPEMQGQGGAADQYWGTMAQFITPYALLYHPTPQKVEEMRRVHNFLKTAPGVGPYDLWAYDEKFVTLPPDPKSDNPEYDLKLATDRDAYGQIRMGQRYRDGDGVTPSDTKAQQFLISAVRQGDPVAACILGSMNPSIPGDQIHLTVSSVWEKDTAAVHLIDGAGMLGAAHDNDGPARTMWFTAERPAPRPPAPGLAPSPAWARFDFAQPTKFESIQIWNENQPNLTDRGFRKTRIYGTTDGTTWIPLTVSPVIELPRATGAPWLLPVTISNEAARRVFKSVIIAAEAIDGDYGSAYYGLSAVRFVAPRLTHVVPARLITATASSVWSQEQAPAHLVDGAGMTGTLHDNHYAAATMWHTTERPAARPPVAGLPASPAWVRFDFAQPQDVEAILIWNLNQQKFTDRGFRKVRIYCSPDGMTWKPLTDPKTIELAPADASPMLGPTTVLNDLTEHTFKSVIIAAEEMDGNYGGNAFGLSAVRFVQKH
jgi:hypothetical protein